MEGFKIPKHLWVPIIAYNLPLMIAEIGGRVYPYIYRWGNNSKRATLKGHKCKVVARGALNSCLIEFEDGQREIISRNALRRVSTALS